MSNSNVIPLVQRKTRSESTNVETIVGRLQSGRIVIPDYQRDAEQWDIRKESLFIESLLNNLTIPAFFFAEVEDGKIEVVDGQQRLNTILKYATDQFGISDDDGINYLVPESILYRGKKLSELGPSLQTVFDDYPLTIIYLPESLELGIKLEIFRRINEGGTPLTAQDIRLSYYNSNSVYLIRLAGIYADTPAARRMIESGEEKCIGDLWERRSQARQFWQDWWAGKALSKGQTPSEMFLWYLVLVHRDELDALLSSPNSMRHLPISFRGSTEEALDIYCAQLQYTDSKGGPPIFPTFGHGLEDEFDNFARYIEVILGYGLTGISVDKYKQIALLIGAMVELGVDLRQIIPDALDAVSEFVRTPRRAGAKWLGQEGGYPEQKGRWKGSKGQKAQCDAVVTLLTRILEKHP